MNTPKRDRQTVSYETFTNSPRTPQASGSFTRELRQVLNERNLLTKNSRERVCSMLDANNAENQLNREADKRKNFRLQAIQEIINTEKAYLSQLEILLNYFLRPIKLRAMIDDFNHTALFGQIEMIYNLNGELLRELESNKEGVAQAFLKMAPFFKLYSVYAFDYKNSLIILQDLFSKYPQFRKFIEQSESRPEVQKKLNSLMIMPIQRVARYKLLLEQVLFYTSPADSDYKPLKASIKEIDGTVWHINSSIQDHEVTEMLIALQQSLANRSPRIVKPSRKIIKEGVLDKISRNGTGIKRYCVLMSDIFMYCKILKDRQPNTFVENSLRCCCIFPLKKCKVFELFPGNFKLTCQNDAIIFGTTDEQLQQTWVGLLRNAIESHIECRKTLRKESSKRVPMRNKDVKNLDADTTQVSNSNKNKVDFDTVFRNSNTDSSDEDTVSLNCFSRSKTIRKAEDMSLKRHAPLFDVDVMPSTSKAAKLCKDKSADKKRLRSILKHSCSTSIPPLQANTNSNDKLAVEHTISNTYVRAHSVDNTIISACDKENTENITPPQKKRVKFEDMHNENGTPVNVNGNVAPVNVVQTVDAPAEAIKKQPWSLEFPPSEPTPARAPSLKDRICGFFVNMFH